MFNESHFNRLVPTGIGFLLWTISGVLTVSLFLDLAGANLFKIILAILWAGGLEASKVIIWRWGGRFRILSLALMGVTLFSALGIALTTVETTQADRRTDATQSSVYYIEETRTIAGLQSQIADDLHRLKALPPDWVTVARSIRSDLAKLRSQLVQSQAQLDSFTSAPVIEAQTPFSLLASSLHLSRKLLEILVILILVILTEASAATLSGQRPKLHPKSGQDQDACPDQNLICPKDQEADLKIRTTLVFQDEEDLVVSQFSGQDQDITAQTYLETALDNPNAPRLLGRAEVAKRLGIGERQARSLLEELIKSGRVQRGAKNFEASQPPNASSNL